MTPPGPVLSRYRLVIYALIVGANVALGVNFLGPAPLLPLIIQDYAISRTVAGLYVASMTLVMTLVTIPVDLLATRFGLRRALVAALFLMGATVPLLFLHGFGPLLASRLVQGVSAAVLVPLLPAMIMRWAPPREIPLVNAASLAAATVGNSAGLLLGAPLAAAFGWPTVLALEGTLGLLGGAVWFLFSRDGPEAARPAGPAPGLATVFRARTTWLLAFAVVGPFALLTSLATWLPTYYTEVRDLSLGSAGLLVAIMTAVGAPAALVAGFWTARTGRRRPILLWTGALIGLGGASTILAPAGPLLYLAVVFGGIVIFAYLPVLFSVPLELPGATPERAGAVIAAIVTVGNISSFLAPVLVGFLRDATGSYAFGLLFTAASAPSLFLAALFLPETGPGRRAASPTVSAVKAPSP